MEDNERQYPVANVIPYVSEKEMLSKCLKINNTDITVNQKGYVNLTALCKAGGKEFKHWKELDSTQEFLQILSKENNMKIEDILYQAKGAISDRVTWGHPQVAIDIAYWISPEFKFKVTKWVFELGLYGKVVLGEERPSYELLSTWQLKCQKLVKLKEKLYTLLDKEKRYADFAEYVVDKKDDEIAMLKAKKRKEHLCSEACENAYIVKNFIMKKYMKPVYLTLIDPSLFCEKIKKPKRPRQNDLSDSEDENQDESEGENVFINGVEYNAEDYTNEAPPYDEIMYYSISFAKKPKKYNTIMYIENKQQFDKIMNEMKTRTYHKTPLKTVWYMSLSVFETYINDEILSTHPKEALDKLKSEFRSRF